VLTREEQKAVARIAELNQPIRVGIPPFAATFLQQDFPVSKTSLYDNCRCPESHKCLMLCVE
jgi:hypothetical protein